MNSSYHVVNYILSTYLSYNLRLCLLTMFIHFSLSHPCLWQPQSNLFSSEFVFVLFCFVLGCTSKWDHIVYVFVWLFSLSIVPSRTIHVVTSSRIKSFVWLKNISLSVIYNSFVHLSINGNLGCFYVLAIVNNAAMNCEYGVQMSLPYSVFLPSNIFPEVELLDYMVVLFLIFWETSILFSIVTGPVYIPTNSVQG